MRLLTRTTTRVVVVDHAYRVLLLHVTDGTTSWWEPPALAALSEELGLTVRVGPCVWTRAQGGLIRTVERLHVGWLDDPGAPRAQAAHRDRVLGEHWWTLDELAGSAERFDPASFPALAPSLVRGEYAT